MQRTPAILYKRYEILYSMAQPKYIPSSFFFFFWQEKEMFVIQMEEYSNRSEACPGENRAHGLPSLTERNIWSRRETRRVVQVFFFFFLSIPDCANPSKETVSGCDVCYGNLIMMAQKNI